MSFGEAKLSQSLLQILVIMFGGALGAAARYILAIKVSEKFGTNYPFGTLSINVIGSFAMGLLAILLVERFALDPLIKLGIFVGFLGAFTTFSTFSIETLSLFEQGQQIKALGYILSSVILSVFAVWMGVILGKALS